MIWYFTDYSEGGASFVLTVTFIFASLVAKARVNMDMHVLAGDGTKYTVVFHFPVPGGDNPAGFPWTAVLASTNPTTILTEGPAAWEIKAPEKTAIETGTVVEWVVQLDIESGRDTAAKVTTALQHAYPRERTEMQDVLGRRFRWYGTTESEA